MNKKKTNKKNLVFKPQILQSKKNLNKQLNKNNTVLNSAVASKNEPFFTKQKVKAVSVVSSFSLHRFRPP